MIVLHRYGAAVRTHDGAAKPQPQPKKKKSAEQRSASTTEAGREGGRPYARGRAYQEGHYNDNDE